MIAHTPSGYQSCVVTAGRITHCEGPASGNAVIAGD
jgi:hypothetical protein